MIFQIKEYYFSRPGNAYIFVQIGNQKRQQICEGGSFRGETISYSGNDDDWFLKICLKWYRQHTNKGGE